MEKTFETEVLTRLAVIEAKLDGYKEIKKAAFDADNRSKQNEDSIRDLQEKNKWLTRTITGAIITGVIGLLFLFVQIGIGVK